MPLVRRVAVAVATLAGLVVAVLGLWLAVVLGPGGTAVFTARATGPVVIGPDVLGALDVPVTVTAHSTADGSDVFLGVAPSGDVGDVVGDARVLRVTQARFPARVLDLRAEGSGSLADPSGLDVWATTARGSVDVARPGSDAVLVAPTGTGPVTITLERRHGTWFIECLVAVLVGLIVAVAGAAWLLQSLGHRIPVGPLGPRRPGRRAPAAARPAPAVPPAPGYDADDEPDADDRGEHEEASR